MHISSLNTGLKSSPEIPGYLHTDFELGTVFVQSF